MTYRSIIGRALGCYGLRRKFQADLILGQSTESHLVRQKHQTPVQGQEAALPGCQPPQNEKLIRTYIKRSRFLHQKFVVTLNRTVRGAEGVMLVSLWPNS